MHHHGIDLFPPPAAYSAPNSAAVTRLARAFGAAQVGRQAKDRYVLEFVLKNKWKSFVFPARHPVIPGKAPASSDDDSSDDDSSDDGSHEDGREWIHPERRR